MTDFAKQLLINGQFVDGQGAPENIINPATGELLVTIPEASIEQIQQAVTAAAKAFPTWKKTSPRDRATMLLKLAD